MGRGRPLNGPNDPRHGTPNGYNNHNCRCDRCRLAATVRHREWEKKDPMRRSRATRLERIRRRRVGKVQRSNSIRANKFVDPAYLLPWPGLYVFMGGGPWLLFLEILKHKRKYGRVKVMMNDTCGCGGTLVMVEIQDTHQKSAPRLTVVCLKSLKEPQICPYTKGLQGERKTATLI